MTDEELKSLFAENRRQVDVAFERTQSWFATLAESVSALDEKLDRRIDEVDERIRRGFEETQSMIKFSHPGAALARSPG